MYKIGVNKGNLPKKVQARSANQANFGSFVKSVKKWFFVLEERAKFGFSVESSPSSPSSPAKTATPPSWVKKSSEVGELSLQPRLLRLVRLFFLEKLTHLGGVPLFAGEPSEVSELCRFGKKCKKGENLYVQARRKGLRDGRED